MKAIFLDFDGVLLTMRTSIAGGKGWTRSAPDFTAMQLLYRCGEAGVKIVISSAHRTHGRTHCDGILDFYAHTFTLTDYVLTDWRTKCAMTMGDDFTSMSRSVEIAEYLARHPEIDDYLIIDDEPHNWTPEQHNRWVQCDGLEGMTVPCMKIIKDWAGVTKVQNGVLPALDGPITPDSSPEATAPHPLA